MYEQNAVCFLVIFPLTFNLNRLECTIITSKENHEQICHFSRNRDQNFNSFLSIVINLGKPLVMKSISLAMSYSQRLKVQDN